METLEIHEAEDGWLFLTGGSNQVLRLYNDPDFFTEADAHAWLALLQQRKARMLEANAAYVHLIAPDKISVFPHRYGAALPHFAAHPLARLLALAEHYDLGSSLPDCTPALNRDFGRFPTFYKTDSHWTVWGAYLAYRVACRAMQLPGEAIVGFDEREFTIRPVIFDLGSKMPVPRTEDHIFTPMHADVTRRHANAIVTLREAAEQTGLAAPMHHGIQVVFTNQRAGCIPATLVIFGDSFCDYRPSTLTAFFAETFAEVHFVWASGVDYAYIDAVKPNYVLTEIAERFMVRLPTDDHDVEEMAQARLAEFHIAASEPVAEPPGRPEHLEADDALSHAVAR